MKLLNKLHIIFTEKPSIKILKKQGLTVGKNLNIQNGVVIDYSHCFLITFGNNVTLAPKAIILAHDASTKEFIGYTKIGKVVIGNNVFVGANSVILPNVKIGNNVIIGAGSIVSKDVPSNCVVAGNPARKISDIDSYLKKFENIPKDLMFDELYTIKRGVSKDKKEYMKEKLSRKIGLIK